MSDCISQLQHTKSVPNIATLKTLALDNELSVFVPGRGNYVWDASSSQTGNDGTIVASSRKSTGRWKLEIQTVIDVRWFDPITFGGSTPDAVAIQSAIDAAPVGATVYLPCALYSLNSTTLKITKDGIRLLGDGQATILYHSGTGSVVESSTKNTAIRSRVIFEGIKFQSNTTTQGNPVVNMKFFQRSIMRDCWVIGNINGGVYGNSLAINVEGDWGPPSFDATYNQFHNVYIGGVFHGILFNHNANSCLVTGGCRFQNIGGFGVWMNDVNHIVITDNEFEYPGNISTGVFAAGNVEVPVVCSNRFESMNIGIDFELGVIKGFIGPNYYSSNLQDRKNDSLNSIVMDDRAIVLQNLRIEREATEGFKVNQSIIAPYLDPVNVDASNDKFFFNSVESAFNFRSFRADTGFSLWNYSAGNYHRIFYVDSTARLRAGDGSAALPSYSFNGDPDTGMFYAGTDHLGLSAGGVKVMGLRQNQINFSIGTIPVYANNAAALVGGLASGDLYRNGSDPDVLSIVH
jgi:hypothetical protein